MVGTSVIMPFTLRDLGLLKQLAGSSVSLNPAEALTHPQSPLWVALSSLLPFDDTRSYTFVLDETRNDGRRRVGFVQLVQPPTRPELHVCTLAPRFDAADDAATIWNRLLNHAYAVACERGLQRIFACAPEDSQELEALVGTGFNSYTREEIYRLEPDTHPQAVAPGGIRPERSDDLWEIEQLYKSVTPHLVRQAEALQGQLPERTCAMSWGEGEGFVLPDRTGIAGYGHLLTGRAGHWLTVLLHPRAGDRAGDLLDYSLALLNYYPPRPVYCAVREYQGWLRAALLDRGFALQGVQCRLVRHATVRVIEPVRGLVPAIEKRAQAPTTTVSPTEGRGAKEW